MHDQPRGASDLHGSAPDLPRYLIHFAIPPFLTALVLVSIDPLVGLALLPCMAVMVIVLKLLFRYER